MGRDITPKWLSTNTSNSLLFHLSQFISIQWVAEVLLLGKAAEAWTWRLTST